MLEKSNATDPSNTKDGGDKENREDHSEENHGKENVEKQKVNLDEPSVIIGADKFGKEMDEIAENHPGRVLTKIGASRQR